MKIPLGVLRATQCCDPESTRYALNAIQLQRLGDGRLQAATTNGRILAIVRWHDDAATTVPLPLLIPRAAAEAIARGNVAKHHDVAAALERASNGQLSLIVRCGNRAERVDFDPADGRFPDVVDAIPKPEFARSVVFDARQLRNLLSAIIDASESSDPEQVAITITFDAAPVADSSWKAAGAPAILSHTREGGSELLAAIMPLEP